MTPTERAERFNRLSEMGCFVCGSPPQIHHLVGGCRRGVSQKAPDEQTIPLCQHHHTGAEGVHTLGVKTWEAHYGTQESMLMSVDQVLEMMN